MTRIFPLVARVFLGLIFTVIGLNGFLGFLPMPPPPPAAGAFFGALAETGYFIPLLKGTEVLAGLALLAGRFVPLALVVLAPIVVNIAAYHIFLTPGELGMAAFLTFLLAFLAWTYRGSFRGVLDPNAGPSA